MGAGAPSPRCPGRPACRRTGVRSVDAPGFASITLGPFGMEGCGRRSAVPILVYEYLRTSPRERGFGYEEMRDGAGSASRPAEDGAAEDQQPARAVAAQPADREADVPVRDGCHAAPAG